MPIMTRFELLFAISVGGIVGLALTVLIAMSFGTIASTLRELAIGAFCGFAIVSSIIMVKNAGTRLRREQW